jgi:hypothetical protein
MCKRILANLSRQCYPHPMNTISSFNTRALLVSLCLFPLAACGNDVTQPTPAPASPKDVGQPPPAPLQAPLPDGPGATFAISKIRLGRIDDDGLASTDFWKNIGYNLDHQVTTKSESTGIILGEETCTRVEGAGFDKVFDGHDGRDNGFGSTVMAVLNSVNNTVEKISNDLIRQGQHTLLIDVQGLGEQPTYQSIHARIYEGRSFVDAGGMPALPLFDGTDVWPVGFESVTSGDIESPLAMTTDGYITDNEVGGTFVGRFGNSIVLRLAVFDLPDQQGLMEFRIHEPLVTLVLSADRSRVESGVLAGFLDTKELEVEAGRMVGILDPPSCNSQTSMGVQRVLREGSDILRGGLRDKTKTCDSISIGITFEAERAHLGTVTEPAGPLFDPCSNMSP